MLHGTEFVSGVCFESLFNDCRAYGASVGLRRAAKASFMPLRKFQIFIFDDSSKGINELGHWEAPQATLVDVSLETNDYNSLAFPRGSTS